MQKIGGDRETAAARIGRQAGLTTEEVLRSPYALIGSPQEVADHVRRVRDEMGISSFRSEEHTSELQSLMRISYAVFCLTKKNNTTQTQTYTPTKTRKDHEIN